jgi:uncharacterized protein YdiU (UPF0061 family)
LKIGLQGTERKGDVGLAHRLLDIMAAQDADFTVTFRALAEGTLVPGLAGTEAFETWLGDWRARLGATDPGPVMRAANPAVIPRNHRVEAMIAAAVQGDLGPMHALTDSLAKPYAAAPDDPLRQPPAREEEVRQTFCGT